MSQTKSNVRNYFFIFLILAITFSETVSGTFVIQEKKHTAEVSIFYFAAGVLLSFLVLVRPEIFAQEKSKKNSKLFFNNFFSLRNFLFFLFTVVFLYFIPIVKKYFSEVPINYHSADMVPILQIQAHRFLAGDKIYATLPEILGSMKPIYLTFMWLPLTISEYFNFDARWIISFCLILGIYFCLSITRNSKIKIVSLISALGLFLIINYMVTKDRATIIFTEEGIVIGYYLFLGFALSRKNPFLISLGIVFCLLSRYILIFWLPVFLLYWYLYQSKKQARYILVISSLLFCATFLLPYGIKDYKFFLNLHEGYIEMAQRIWKGDPEFTWKTLGLAKFFDIQQIPLLHQILIISSILAPIVYFSVFWIFRNYRKMNSEMFTLGLLKLTLVIFFNFLEMPYFYLFYTSTLFSYCLLFNYLNLVEIKYTTKSNLSYAQLNVYTEC